MIASTSHPPFRLLMQRRLLHAMFTLPVALLTAACAAGEGGPAPRVVRDSAGVQIVENHAPMLGDDAWSVSEGPVVQIGDAGGSPEYWFGEIMGMVRLSTGHIAVADMGTSQIKLYDAGGRFVRAVGRKGQGPGEFTQIQQLHRLRGDSLLVEEFHPHAHLFDPQGRYVRTIQLGVGDGGPFGNRLIGALADGTYLALTPRVARPGTPMSESATLLRLDPGGAVRDTVGAFRTVQWGEGSPARPGPLLFGPRGPFAVTDQGFYHGFSDQYQLNRYAANGELERQIRRRWTPEPITREDREAYRERYLGMSGEGGRAVPERLRAQRERLLAAMQLAEQRPAYGNLVADQAGNLWVQEYSIAHQLPQGRFRPTFPEPSRWSVFDPEGRWITSVTLPGNLLVMEIGEDHVLGLARDESDADQVRMYRLRKGQ